MTFHPSILKRAALARSLLTFREILLTQYFFARALANCFSSDGSPRVFHCRPCQKSPSMKTASLQLLKAISGQPGSDLTCALNETLRRRMSRNTVLSTRVPLPLIRDIRALRLVLERKSVPAGVLITAGGKCFKSYYKPVVKSSPRFWLDGHGASWVLETGRDSLFEKR